MNDAPAVENPFRDAPVAAAPQEVMATIGSQREIAEVQVSMTVARRFPRNQVEVMDQILQACTRPSLAEGALYEYARGGTDIRGPSIRLAECLAQYWGNVHFGWRVLEERPGVTKVEAYAWDLQTNVRPNMIFDVLHERHTKTGKSVLHDPRDIYEHVANAASRRLRACILRAIPGDVQEAAVRQCEATLKLKLEVTPQRLQNLVAQFAEFGVTQAMIEKRIQRRLDAMTPGLMVQLGRIFTSLRDNMSQPGDWFEITPAGTPAQAPGSPQAAPATGGRSRGTQAVKERLGVKGKPQAGAPGQDVASAPLPPKQAPAPAPDEQPQPSQAFQDIVRFARVATTNEDMERVRAIALQLTDEAEVEVAQQHIDAATARIAG